MFLCYILSPPQLRNPSNIFLEITSPPKQNSIKKEIPGFSTEVRKEPTLYHQNSSSFLITSHYKTELNQELGATNFLTVQVCDFCLVSSQCVSLHSTLKCLNSSSQVFHSTQSSRIPTMNVPARKSFSQKSCLPSSRMKTLSQEIQKCFF